MKVDFFRHHRYLNETLPCDVDPPRGAVGDAQALAMSKYERLSPLLAIRALLDRRARRFEGRECPKYELELSLKTTLDLRIRENISLWRLLFIIKPL